MIYLINPSERGFLENAGDRMPLGLMSIATNLERHGQHVKIFDMNHRKRSDLRMNFEHDQPVRAMGISIYTSPSLPEALDIADEFRGRTRLIAGGYHPTAMPNSLRPHFDSIVQGEGDYAIFDALVHDGVIDARAQKINLSTLPNPRRSLVDVRRYGVSQTSRKQDAHRTATLITSRGCPYSCSFCGKMSSNVRLTPADRIREQISQVEQEDFDAIYFVDDIFTLDPIRVRQMTEDMFLPYRATTRVNLADESRLAALARTGCEIVSMGLESGNDEILARANKHQTTDQIREAVRCSRRMGMSVKGFFIIGLPGETEETARQTIEFSQELRELGLDQADFYYLTPFPGTPIWKNPEAFGITIRDRDFTKYLQVGKGAHCVVDTEGLKAERIEELVMEARGRWR